MQTFALQNLFLQCKIIFCSAKLFFCSAKLFVCSAKSNILQCKIQHFATPHPAKKRGLGPLGAPGVPLSFWRGGALFLDGFVDFLNNFNHARTWILHCKMLDFALQKILCSSQRKYFAMQNFAFEGVPTTPRLSNPPLGET